MQVDLIQLCGFVGGGVLTILMTIVGFFLKRLIDKVESLTDRGEATCIAMASLKSDVKFMTETVEKMGEQIDALIAFREDMAYVRGRMNGSLDRNGDKKNGS